MLIDFDQIEEIAIPNLNQGEGTVSARMFLDGKNKIMISRLPKGASIGSHRHSNSSEINFVVSGEGKAMCDGKEESLLVGKGHYCPKGSEHSIVNIGKQELVLFTVVVAE